MKLLKIVKKKIKCSFEKKFFFFFFSGEREVLAQNGQNFLIKVKIKIKL